MAMQVWTACSEVLAFYLLCFNITNNSLLCECYFDYSHKYLESLRKYPDCSPITFSSCALIVCVMVAVGTCLLPVRNAT